MAETGREEEPTATPEQLGPFSQLWNAWNESADEIRAKNPEHFQRATELQFEELFRLKASGDRDGAAREAVDVISIALNTLRWLRYSPEEIAKITRARAEKRMFKQTRSILEKYKRKHNI